MKKYEYDVALPFAGEISADEELSDPLLALAGTLTCEATDISERHDEYIGQALLEEMRDADNE